MATSTREVQPVGSAAPANAVSMHDKLAYAVRLAMLAPSSHNTQPWKFRLRERSVDLLADHSRALEQLDPDHRQLIISCGAALFALRVAMANLGYRTTLELLPDPSEVDWLATVELAAESAAPEKQRELFAALETRHTNRAEFRADEVPPAMLQDLRFAALDEGAELVFISEPGRIEAVLQLIAAADRLLWQDEAIRREQADWLRPAEGATDGIPVAATGAGHLVSRFVPWFIRHANLGETQARKDVARASSGGSLAVLVTKRDTTLDWLAAGQALMQVLLRAENHGLAASYFNQVILANSIRAQLQTLVGRGMPQLCLRFGYAPEAAATPRRSLDEVLI